MDLILSIADVETLDNGGKPSLRLERYGAVIGRSPQADWCLPDTQRFISSIHCEIDFRKGEYVLTDKSTNGVFVNGSLSPLAANPHVIADGDELAIGPYRIHARLEAAGARQPPPPPPPPPPVWPDWEPKSAAPPPDPASPEGRGYPNRESVISGAGPMSRHWAPPPVAPSTPSVDRIWDPPTGPATPASILSSPIPEHPGPPSAAEIWAKLAEGHAVDWSRGGFGPRPVEALAPVTPDDRLGLAAPSGDRRGIPGASPPLRTAPAAPRPQPFSSPALWETSPSPAVRPAGVGGEWAAFLGGAGVAPADIKTDPATALADAGDLMRRLVAGLVILLEGRATAKAQLGAQGTTLSFDGNNPLKFARSPERALAQLLNSAERGFMPADRAVEDAFRDLQAHQMATLNAMQGALAATLARFSPQAIRDRAEMRGLLSKILPVARDAELWKAYEREFEGVARGSDEAFMDVFAKEFRQAYEKAAADTRGRR